MKTDKVIVAFKIGPHQQDRIISPMGCLPTIPAGHHLNAQWMNLILEIEENEQMLQPGDA
jgi:hypothetical protein